ncbi:MAG: HAD family hydrolase [Acidobacteria bacterium]|nr:MAG: HAD family hydrolase [Acidobacteriota bacterium]
MTLREKASKATSDRQLSDPQGQASPSALKMGWVSADRTGLGPASFTYIQPGFDWTASHCYLFDIDGTLLNSRDAVHYHAFHRAVATVFGLEFRLDGVPVHGNTDVGILRAYFEQAGLPAAEWRSRLPQALEFMSAEVERNAEDLCPEVCRGIPDVLQRLSDTGKLLGVASGNLERVGWAKLKACGLRRYFSFGGFSGELEKRDDIIAHGIEQARRLQGSDTTVCVIGDTPADIRSAHANDAPAIAIATGIYGTEELVACDPEMCVQCCEDLLRI